VRRLDCPMRGASDRGAVKLSLSNRAENIPILFEFGGTQEVAVRRPRLGVSSLNFARSPSSPNFARVSHLRDARVDGSRVLVVGWIDCF